MTHTHHATGDVPVQKRRALTIAASVLAVAIAVGLAVLWPSTETDRRLQDLGFGSEFYDAEVDALDRGPCDGTSGTDDLDCTEVFLRLLQGPDKGETTILSFADSPTTPKFEVADTVVLSRQEDAPPGFEYAFADRARKPVLAWLAGVFALGVILLGRLRGLAALAGLAASFFILLRFVLPAVLAGESPLLVAVIGSAAIAFVAIYVAHGFGSLTTVALLGTLGALVVTVAAAEVFVSLADFSGFASEEAIFLNIAQGTINLNGLTLGGIVIGALGAIDDMTVTQASVVAELRDANPGLSGIRLFTSAMRVGRDHVASTVNTLALAYAGASMPLLILFILAGQSLGTVANGEIVATEIVRTLVGSLGLITAVPLTTWLAVWAVTDRTGDGRPTRARRHRDEPPDPFAEAAE
jgi:uncharacterized membrane protein